MSDSVFDPDQNTIVPGENNDFDLIGDDVYNYVLNKTAKLDLSKTSWYPKLKTMELVADLEPKNAMIKCIDILD